MSAGLKTVIYPVKDLASSKPVFTALLGVEPYVDEPYYVGFRVGDQEIGLDPHGHAKGMTGGLAYCHVDDVPSAVQALLAAGAVQREAPHDVGGGMLIATVTDPDGNVIGLRQAA